MYANSRRYGNAIVARARPPTMADEVQIPVDQFIAESSASSVLRPEARLTGRQYDRVPCELRDVGYCLGLCSNPL
jgi:hypothetical protein